MHIEDMSSPSPDWGQKGKRGPFHTCLPHFFASKLLSFPIPSKKVLLSMQIPKLTIAYFASLPFPPSTMCTISQGCSCPRVASTNLVSSRKLTRLGGGNLASQGHCQLWAHRAMPLGSRPGCLAPCACPQTAPKKKIYPAEKTFWLWPCCQHALTPLSHPWK